MDETANDNNQELIMAAGQDDCAIDNDYDQEMLNLNIVEAYNNHNMTSRDHNSIRQRHGSMVDDMDYASSFVG